MKERPKTNTLYFIEMNNGKSKGWMVAIVVVVVIVLVVVIAVSARNGAQPPTAQSGSAQAPSRGSYTSSADGFSVNFPGPPQVVTTTFNSMTAGSLPLTTYKATAPGSSTAAYYAVMVYHYPASYRFPDNYLAGALQVFGMAVNVKHPGTAIATQTPTQLEGQPALSALVTVPINGVNTDDYVMITTKGQDTYILDEYGLPESDFTSFIGSFSFAQ